MTKIDFVNNGFSEVSENNYSLTYTITVGYINNIPQTQEIVTDFEVDPTETEYGYYIVFRRNKIIIHTGYYTDINDLLGELR